MNKYKQPPKDRVMHKSTCSKCGKDCQVPFKPTGDKPVYCSDCFTKDSKKRYDDYSDKGRRGRHDSRSMRMHDATCSKCGKDCQVPFKPTGDKPVYCSDCFDPSSRVGIGKSYAPKTDDTARRFISLEMQLNQLNEKIDQLTQLVQTQQSTQAIDE